MKVQKTSAALLSLHFTRTV